MAKNEFSVASILESISSTISDITVEDMKAEGNYEATTTVLKAEQAAKEQAAKDATTVEAAKQAGVLQKEQRISAVMEALNFDSLSVELATKLKDSGERLSALEDTIAKKQSVGFLDNPLLWLGAQMSVQPDIEAFNAEVDRYELTKSHSDAVNNMSQEVAATAQAAITTVTADSAAAASRIAGVEFSSAAREASIKALVNDTARLKFMKDSSLQKISLQADARRILDAEESQRMQREAFAMQRESHKVAMEKAARDAADAKKSDDFEKKVLTLINAGAVHIGRRPFSSMEDYKLFATKKGNVELAQQMSDIGYQIFERAELAKVGKTPSTVVRMGEYSGDVAMLLVEGRGTLRQSPAVDKFLKDSYILAKSGKATLNGAPVDVKNPASITAFVTSAANAKAKVDARDIAEGGRGNIYAAPTYAELIATIGGDTKMPPLYHKLFAESVKANPMQQVDPATLYHRTLEAVVANKVTFNEAVEGLKQIGDAAKETNNSIRNYAAAGLPEQRTYTTRTKLTKDAFFERDIDLTNLTDLKTKLALAATATKSLGMLGSVQPNPTLPTSPIDIFRRR